MLRQVSGADMDFVARYDPMHDVDGTRSGTLPYAAAFETDRFHRQVGAWSASDRAAVLGHQAPIAASDDVSLSRTALGWHDVGHRFRRRRVLDAVTLDVRSGELLCLLGPSGCGKTTLLRLAAGLEPVQVGSIVVAGRVVAGPRYGLAPERRGVGLVFQDYALFPHLSVFDNVAFGLSGLPQRERRHRTEAALERVGMATYTEAYPHMLSGGQQQRVALARALAPRPRVLLLDEPFSGLDAGLRQQVRDDTLDILRSDGITTVMVTHDAEEAMLVSDRIALMNAGQIVQVGTPQALYHTPQSAFAAGFIGEINRLTGHLRGCGVDTVLGHLRLAATPCGCCHTDGAAVDVMVRPERLRLSVAGGADKGPLEPPLARVESVRSVGSCTLVRLAVLHPAGDPVTLTARVPICPVPAGKLASVTIEPGCTHVFAGVDRQ